MCSHYHCVVFNCLVKFVNSEMKSKARRDETSLSEENELGRIRVEKGCLVGSEEGPDFGKIDSSI